MLNNSRGQISVEFVLLIGLILVLVLGVSTTFQQNIELNSAMSAAKIGFIGASNNLAYSNGNIIRLNGMNFNNGTITAGYYSSKALNDNDKYNIEVNMIDSISKTLNVPVQWRTNTNSGCVQTNDYKYIIQLS